MAIPDFQTMMSPLLRVYADGCEHANNEVLDTLAVHFRLTSEERKQMLPSNRQTVFANRVAWARTYFTATGLLKRQTRGVYKITELGTGVAQKKSQTINLKFLSQYPGFHELRSPRPKTIGLDSKRPGGEHEDSQGETATPQAMIETALEKLRNSLALEILQQIANCPPAFFERLVLDLIVKMGYGGSREDAGEHVGKSGDEGVDAIINEDKLGLDVVYIQAKRWKNSVGNAEIRNFIGALAGKRAKKGIVITTSNFTDNAKKAVEGIDYKIVLIDGFKLASLMMDYNVGVSPVATYELKKIDSDYFTEE